MPSTRAATGRRRSITSPRAGRTRFHGNLYELWNGSRLNAANFFTNATAGGHKPRSNVNHFGGSLGGPIVRDKLFFFGDFEQMRIALPIVNTVTLPSAAYQSYVLQQLPKGGIDPVSGSSYPAAPALVPFYQKMFSLYPNTAGTPLPVLGCPFNADGSPRQAPRLMETVVRTGGQPRSRVPITSRWSRPGSTTTST
jgi:hypothetical protein